MNYKRLGLSIGALTIAGATTFALQPKPTGADFDLPGLNQQVQVQQSQLDNHEARITNNETDIKALQSGVTPSTVLTPGATPAPGTTVAPVTDPTPTPGVSPAPVVTPPHPTYAPITRGDIDNLLASIAPPGEQRDQKMQACRNLYAKENQSEVSGGYHLCSEMMLSSYASF